MLSIRNVMNEVNVLDMAEPHQAQSFTTTKINTHCVMSKANSIEHYLLTKQTCPDSIPTISAISHVNIKTKSIMMKLKPTEYIERDPIIEKMKNNIILLYIEL